MDKQPTTLQWLRGPTLNGIVAFDTFGTIAGVYLLTHLIKYSSSFSFGVLFVILLIITFISAILIHYLTGTPTMLNHYLGLNTLDAVMKARE